MYQDCTALDGITGGLSEWTLHGPRIKLINLAVYGASRNAGPVQRWYGWCSDEESATYTEYPIIDISAQGLGTYSPTRYLPTYLGVPTRAS